MTGRVGSQGRWSDVERVLHRGYERSVLLGRDAESVRWMDLLLTASKPLSSTSRSPRNAGPRIHRLVGFAALARTKTNRRAVWLPAGGVGGDRPRRPAQAEQNRGCNPLPHEPKRRENPLPRQGGVYHASTVAGRPGARAPGRQPYRPPIRAEGADTLSQHAVEVEARRGRAHRGPLAPRVGRLHEIDDQMSRFPRNAQAAHIERIDGTKFP